MNRRTFMKLAGVAIACPKLPTPKAEILQGLFWRFEYSGGKIAGCYPQANHPCSEVLKLKYQGIRMTPKRWEEIKKLLQLKQRGFCNCG